jgi:methyltransferase (TIGR00027 family)
MTAETRVNAALGTTARWTAAVRAAEHERPDRLFADPWAAALAGTEGAAWLADRPPGSTLPIVIRTRYFDDWLRRVAIDGPVRQVVLLAAGLDTRAWRLPWLAATRLFELDRADVLALKADVMARAGAVVVCDRREVAVDLAAAWTESLLAVDFDPTQPTAFLAEGVLFYLPDEVVMHVVDGATSLAAPGSWLGFDIVNGAALSSPWTRPWIEMQAAAGAPWIGTMDDPAGALAERGWAASLVQPGEPEANHGRWTLPVVPPSAADLPHSWYVTASRP